MSDHTPTPWMWAWRDDENAPASIFSMVKEGHAYAVAMCPRYQKPEQWVADAKLIVKAVNNHASLVEFAKYVLEMDPTSNAPLFAKARRVISLAEGADPRPTTWQEEH